MVRRLTEARAILQTLHDCLEGVERDMAGQVIDTWDEALALLPEWVPCSERLPKEGSTVLAYLGRKHMVSAFVFRGGEWHREDATESYVRFPDIVTHWQPLPEPPGGSE